MQHIATGALALAFSITTAQVRADNLYCAYDIGSFRLDGSGHTYPAAINNRGQVVGWSDTTSGGRAFVWEARTGLRDLGVFPGDESSFANDINDWGVIVGASLDDEAHLEHAFVWTESDGMQRVTIPYLEGASYRGEAINNLGQIVGGSASRPANPINRAYLLEPSGEVVDLGSFEPNGDSFATEINDLATVVGVSTRAYNGQAFVWRRRHGMRLLPSDPPADFGSLWASDVNNVNQVLATSESYGSFVWSERGGLTMLDPEEYTSGFAINDFGQVVGKRAGRAIVWDRRRGVRDLNELIHATSPTGEDTLLERADDINEWGWIAAHGSTENGPSRTVVLVPKRFTSTRCPPL